MCLRVTTAPTHIVFYQIERVDISHWLYKKVYRQSCKVLEQKCLNE